MDRVLIVRLGALGDIVHAIPVAAALRRARPDVRIDWIVREKHRPLLDLVTVVDRRIVSGRTAIGALRRGKYDVALDVQGLLKSAVLARASGAPRVIGFAPPFLRERLARAFYTETYLPPAGAVHVVRLNLGLLEPLGILAGEPEFPIEHVDTAAAGAVRDRTANRYAVLNPGAAWPNKRWPPAWLGAVSRALRETHGLVSVVLWGPGEEGLAAEVVANAGGTASLLPPTSIVDLVAILRGAALMVSGDTGPLHIAAAVGTPLVGIYGPTRPSRNGPWSKDDIAVSRDQVCECHHLRRCRRQASEVAPHEAAEEVTRQKMCLDDIAVDEVVGAIDHRLAIARSRVDSTPPGQAQA